MNCNGQRLAFVVMHCLLLLSPYPDLAMACDQISVEADNVAFCGISLRQGRRNKMEDRAVCTEDAELLGHRFAAVYDGHQGDQTATYLAAYLHNEIKHRLTSYTASHIQREQLEHVVMTAAAAVDAAVLELVQQQRLTGGTTAVFALVSGSQILLGHLGDSKAILCHLQTSSTPPAANRNQQHTETAAHPRQQYKLHTATLTNDHSPDRPDELGRITAAGGFVSRATAGSPARLQGELAVSRAFGDLSYRKYGLTAHPELRWHNTSAANIWLILVSDGVLEKMSEDDVCQVAMSTEHGRTLLLHSPNAIPLGPSEDEGGAPHLLHGTGLPEQHACTHCVGQASDNRHVKDNAGHTEQQHGPASLQQAIADRIQTAAYESGSSDNLAVVVLALNPQPSAGPAADSSLCCKAAGMTAEANCVTSAPECTPLQEECVDSQSTTARTASEDAIIPTKQRSKFDQELGKSLKHALPAELASEFEHAVPPEWPGVTVWRDVSQELLGSIVANPHEPSAQYKLVHQMAQLPRYADHVHTSGAGFPVLSTMSHWLQPHLPRFATSSCPTSPLSPLLHAEGGPCTDEVWEPGEGLGASLPQGSSQVMLSPGTMLQLVPGTDAIPGSCSWDAQDSSACGLRSAEEGCSGSFPDSFSTQDNTDWLVTTTVALAQLTSGMHSDAHVNHEQGVELADDAVGQQPVDAVSTSNSTRVQLVPGVVPDRQHDAVQEWQRYQRGRNFARGSFGEVWHAEKAFAGQPHSTSWQAQHVESSQEETSKVVLKRVFTERGAKVRLAGLREAYFGKLLQKSSVSVLQAHDDSEQGYQSGGVQNGHLVRFLESFQSGPDMWLVFHDEGTSLHSLMYSARPPSRPTPDPPTPPKPTKCGDTVSIQQGKAATADEGNKLDPQAGTDKQQKPECEQAAQGQAQQAQQAHLQQGGLWQSQAEQGAAEQAKEGPARQSLAEHSQAEEDEAEEGINMSRADSAASEASPDVPQWVPMMEASGWWWSLRRQPQAQLVIRDLLHQMLSALAVLQQANITHRDVKPENLLIQRRHRGHESSPGQGPDQATGPDDTSKPFAVGELHLRLIDFGSALDKHSIEGLYGGEGPSDDEQTAEYAPPEVLLARYWGGGPVMRRTWPYDMWSVGVVWLELLLATPHVFQITPRTAARLHHHLHLHHKSQADAVLAYLLRGLMELCIYPPRPAPGKAGKQPRGSGRRTTGHPSHAEHPGAEEERQQTRFEGSEGSLDTTPVSAGCTDEAVMEVIRRRDPTHQGLPNQAAVRLLLLLLHWNPGQRPTAAEALRHAYFVLPLQTNITPACSQNRSLAGWC